MPRTAEDLALGLIEAVVSARDDAAAAKAAADALAPRVVSADTLAKAAELLDGPPPATPPTDTVPADGQ